MTDATIALIRERAATLTTVEFDAFQLQVSQKGYLWRSSWILDARARLLHESGLDPKSPEALRLIDNPTEEAWATTKAAQLRIYEGAVARAIADATAASAAFCLLSVEEMARFYAQRPDARLWMAITAPLDRSVREEVESVGDCLLDEEMERQERVEWESRGY